LTPEWLDDIRSRLCELPIKRQLRYVNEYGLSDYDAGVLTSERSTAEFFDEVVKAGGQPKRVCNVLTQTGLKIANEKGCSVTELGVPAEEVAKLAQDIDTGKISASSAKTVFEEMVTRIGVQVSEGISVRDAVTVEIVEKELKLIQKSDADELEAIVDLVLTENPKALEDVTSGGKKSKKARGFLLGQVMQKTKGQANPKVVSEILAKKLV